MKEYFHCPEPDRPKVFGMTASPVWNTKNPLESLEELERNTDSKLVTVQHHVNELSASAPRPAEVRNIILC
jgi:endoribonuclease Dicer